MNCPIQKYGYIYKITNRINNNCYIGKTTRSVTTRFMEHMRMSLNKQDNLSSLLHQEMKQYGIKYFTVETLAYAQSEDELNILEEKYIAFYRKKQYENNFKCLNIAKGGKARNISKSILCLDENKNYIYRFNSKEEMTQVLNINMYEVNKLINKKEINNSTLNHFQFIYESDYQTDSYNKILYVVKRNHQFRWYTSIINLMYNEKLDLQSTLEILTKTNKTYDLLICKINMVNSLNKYVIVNETSILTKRNFSSYNIITSNINSFYEMIEKYENANIPLDICKSKYYSAIINLLNKGLIKTELNGLMLTYPYNIKIDKGSDYCKKVISETLTKIREELINKNIKISNKMEELL